MLYLGEDEVLLRDKLRAVIILADIITIYLSITLFSSLYYNRITFNMALTREERLKLADIDPELAEVCYVPDIA